jgi:hypothetical protein
MYEDTLYNALFDIGFFGKLIFALGVVAVSLGLSLVVGRLVELISSAAGSGK